jgi:hypothetical protein
MFRTADAVGVSSIYLSGVTPAPLDRFGRPQKEIAKNLSGIGGDAFGKFDKFEGKIEKLEAEASAFASAFGCRASQGIFSEIGDFIRTVHGPTASENFG